MRCDQSVQQKCGPSFIMNIRYIRLCVIKIVDICIYIGVYCFDRVDPNCTFRGDFVRFILEFLLSLIVMVLVCA